MVSTIFTVRVTNGDDELLNQSVISRSWESALRDVLRNPNPHDPVITLEGSNRRYDDDGLLEQNRVRFQQDYPVLYKYIAMHEAQRRVLLLRPARPA